MQLLRTIGDDDNIAHVFRRASSNACVQMYTRYTIRDCADSLPIIFIRNARDLYGCACVFLSLDSDDDAGDGGGFGGDSDSLAIETVACEWRKS